MTDTLYPPLDMLATDHRFLPAKNAAIRLQRLYTYVLAHNIIVHVDMTHARHH